MSTQTQELEALEARLKEAEQRLKQASGNSPPRRKDSQRRSPLEGVFPEQDKARLQGPNSPLAQKNAQQELAGTRSETPASQNSADYVLVERPRSTQAVNPEIA